METIRWETIKWKNKYIKKNKNTHTQAIDEPMHRIGILGSLKLQNQSFDSLLDEEQGYEGPKCLTGKSRKSECGMIVLLATTCRELSESLE